MCRPDRPAAPATSWRRSARLEAPGASKIAEPATSSGQQPDRASDPPPARPLGDPRWSPRPPRLGAPREGGSPATLHRPGRLCEPRRAVESADAMSTILACETGARSGGILLRVHVGAPPSRSAAIRGFWHLRARQRFFRTPCPPNSGRSWHSHSHLVLEHLECSRQPHIQGRGAEKRTQRAG